MTPLVLSESIPSQTSFCGLLDNSADLVNVNAGSASPFSILVNIKFLSYFIESAAPHIPVLPSILIGTLIKSALSVTI